MNKIFKVVWNRTIQSFVVTSELAKGRVKSSAEQNSADVSAESGKNGIATVFRLTVISAALLGQAMHMRQLLRLDELKLITQLVLLRSAVQQQQVLVH